jgi:hypothetical protein
VTEAALFLEETKEEDENVTVPFQLAYHHMGFSVQIEIVF